MISRWSIGQVWSRVRVRSLGRAAALILLGALAVGGPLALRALRPPAERAPVPPGQQLALDIAAAAMRTEGARVASGSYIAGDRLLLYTRTSEPDRARVRALAAAQLGPFADRLAKLPAREQLVWVIDFGPAPARQETLVVPLGHALEPAYYRFVSSDPAMLQGAPQVAEAPAQPEPQAQPTAAPQPEPQAQPAQPEPQAQPTAAPQAPAQPQAPPAALPDGAQGKVVLSTTFDETGAQQVPWLPLSGSWKLEGGLYRQTDSAGYDYISLLNLDPLGDYSLAARMRIGEGTMGGGLVYNAPSKGVRSGAQIVDFDRQGSFLRWGRYDANGGYVYVGGAAIDPPINDGKWHDLQVTTHGASSVITLDGRQIATVPNSSASGYYGLTTSVTAVDFDAVQVVALPQQGDAAAPALPTPAPQPTAAPQPAALSSTFDDGKATGWQVLSGTWQVVDGVYQQNDMAGSDLGSVSPIQSDAYTITVRVKRIDGDMGAGIYYNMAARDSRNRSQMVGYTQGGKVLQWGHFDEGGNFVFEGSAQVPDGNDGQWHTLSVRVADGKATIALDGAAAVEGLPLTYGSGFVGLLASHSKVGFDDVQITAR